MLSLIMTLCRQKKVCISRQHLHYLSVYSSAYHSIISSGKRRFAMIIGNMRRTFSQSKLRIRRERIADVNKETDFYFTLPLTYEFAAGKWVDKITVNWHSWLLLWNSNWIASWKKRPNRNNNLFNEFIAYDEIMQSEIRHMCVFVSFETWNAFAANEVTKKKTNFSVHSKISHSRGVSLRRKRHTLNDIVWLLYARTIRSRSVFSFRWCVVCVYDVIPFHFQFNVIVNCVHVCVRAHVVTFQSTRIHTIVDVVHVLHTLHAWVYTHNSVWFETIHQFSYFLFIRWILFLQKQARKICTYTNSTTKRDERIK